MRFLELTYKYLYSINSDSIQYSKPTEPKYHVKVHKWWVSEGGTWKVNISEEQGI